MAETLSTLAPVMQFLNRHEPYKSMLPVHQEYLAMHLEQVFYAKGEIILQPSDGPVDCLYIIKYGLVHLERTDISFSAGDSFPLYWLLEGVKVPAPLTAQKTTICFCLHRQDFEYLMQQSPVFHMHCMQGIHSANE